MNYDLITLVSKLRNVKTMEELEAIKELGEGFMRKEKNYALLTLMAVAEELGTQEVLDSVEKMRDYLKTILNQ